MGIGESVERQDQKITLCQATVILILKGKHIWCKRKGSGEESALHLMRFFHWWTVIFRTGIFNNFFFYQVKKKREKKAALREHISQLRVSRDVMTIDLKCKI